MPQKITVKVAAYVRVSVDSAQTRHSFEAQETYYKEVIEKHNAWEFAGIYADMGVSGTGLSKRKEFQRMLSDCEMGKIDKILVKSVSRFARNTVDLLRIVRQLKQKNISVWFEEQQIDSLTEEGELMLTLMASIAQAEIESISENAKWAIRERFKRGIGNTRHRTFGYKWVDGQMVIVPEEADVVKRIFAHFLAGGSHLKMARKLAEEGVTSIHGNPLSVCAISNILRNITYTGNLILQKTFVQDPISKKKIRNTGQLPQYIVWNDHEAIIDMETFQKVQAKFAKNKEMGKFPYRCKN